MSEVGVHSEKITESKVLTIDEAKNRKGVTGKSAESFEKEIIEMQDKYPQFKDIMSVVFGWKRQPDGDRKLVSKHTSGKIMFPDKSEDIKEIEPGNAYLCLVYEPELNAKGEPARETFAKIICEEYQPKIFVLSSRVVTYAYRDGKGKMKRGAAFGNSFEERLLDIIKRYEKLGFPSAKIVYRKNMS
jgi:hypothetical protein